MKQFRFFFFQIIICLPGLSAQQPQPNILLIIADDMGIDMTNGYQENALMPATPNLDALRSSGITYKNTWSSPTCTPTRAAIMSGKYGIHTGVMRAPGNLNLVDTSLFTMIDERTNNAYAQAVIGKWHISNPVDFDHPQMHGVDHYEGSFTAMVGDYYEWEKITNGESSMVQEYVTSHLTDAAIDWIGDQDKPWLLWLAHPAPHSPFHVPPDGLYSIENTSGQSNRYIAAIEAMDHEIGRLLASFDEQTRENTIIIFVGDNGTPGRVIQFFDSSHSKSSLYEGGIRVPMIISGKGVGRINEMEDGLTQLCDLYATILELAGIPLPGGIHNSYSLKPSLQCADQINRPFIYSDFEEASQFSWAIRNERYKLIEDENGQQEFYDVVNDLGELENLIGSLSSDQEAVLNVLMTEANTIRTGWSCNDGIQNGDEQTPDGCEANCVESTVLSTTNIGCCETPDQPSVFYEFIEDGKRNIYTNDFPNHNYCFNPNLIPEQKHYHFRVDLEPQIANAVTPMTRPNGRPARYFGVAKNGVIMAPAPAQPFIFENPNTGEFNWDWVFEPLNNQGEGRDRVALDCASAHTGPQGYHYHGNMYEYLETIFPGATTTSIVPEEPIHIGWAADGFPILYRFGPDADGNIKELLPSYQLRSGLRPGDGITEPCGPYNGKYTVDYEYLCGKGDLDECNGIRSSVTVTTANGLQIFEYFYVVTSSFPQISRCLVGNVSLDFDNGQEPLTGVDQDSDGFLSQFDCDDTDASINPLAVEIEENDIDENCDGLLTSNYSLGIDGLIVGPNPSNGKIMVRYESGQRMDLSLYNVQGKLLQRKQGIKRIHIGGLENGIYIVKINLPDGRERHKK